MAVLPGRAPAAAVRWRAEWRYIGLLEQELNVGDAMPDFVLPEVDYTQRMESARIVKILKAL